MMTRTKSRARVDDDGRTTEDERRTERSKSSRFVCVLASPRAVLGVGVGVDVDVVGGRTETDCESGEQTSSSGGRARWVRRANRATSGRANRATSG